MVITAAIGIAVIGLVIAITIISGTPHSSAGRPRSSGTPNGSASSHASGSPGSLRWTYTTGGSAASPAVAGGTVYVGSDDGKVYALNAATEQVRWTYTTGSSVSSPAVAGGTVYIGSWDHKVYALNAATGQVRWTYTTGGYVASSPAVAGGTVYVGSYDGKVYALNAATGQRPLDLHHRKLRLQPGGGGRHRLRRQRGRQGVRAGRRHRPGPLDLHHRKLRPPARRWRAAPSTSAARTARCTR